jgi:hypothetical protein
MQQLRAFSCVDALHGKPMPYGLPLVADFDLNGKAAETVSRAIWIGNVYDSSQARDTQEVSVCPFGAHVSVLFHTHASRSPRLAF